MGRLGVVRPGGADKRIWKGSGRNEALPAQVVRMSGSRLEKGRRRKLSAHSRIDHAHHDGASPLLPLRRPPLPPFLLLPPPQPLWKLSGPRCAKKSKVAETGQHKRKGAVMTPSTACALRLPADNLVGRAA